MTASRISTGLPAIDEWLGGGIPAGSVVAIDTPPAAPIGLLLAELISTDDLDAITYLTTDRRPAAIRRLLDSRDTAESETRSVPLDLIDARTDIVHSFGSVVDELAARAGSEPATTGGTPATVQDHAATGANSSADERAARVDSQAISGTATAGETTSTADGTAVEADGVDAVVVDTLTGVISTGADYWRDHVDSLVAWAHETGGMAYLVLRHPPARTLSAGESRVLYRADVVFEYRHSEDGGGSDQLAVPKFRGGARPAEPITLDVAEQLGVNPDRRV